MLGAVKALWKACEEHAQQHKASYNKAHNWAHGFYLLLVSMKGPYHWAALACVILMIAGWALHLEVAEEHGS